MSLVSEKMSPWETSRLPSPSPIVGGPEGEAVFVARSTDGDGREWRFLFRDDGMMAFWGYDKNDIMSAWNDLGLSQDVLNAAEAWADRARDAVREAFPTETADWG